MKIYVAGKYAPHTLEDCNNDLHAVSRIVNNNTKDAIRCGIELIRLGHIPYIPHLSHFIFLELKENEPDLPREFWYKFDYEFLEHCDALFLLSHSRGADKELQWAKEHGLQIFYSLSEVPKV